MALYIPSVIQQSYPVIPIKVIFRIHHTQSHSFLAELRQERIPHNYGHNLNEPHHDEHRYRNSLQQDSLSAQFPRETIDGSRETLVGVPRLGGRFVEEEIKAHRACSNAEQELGDDERSEQGGCASLPDDTRVNPEEAEYREKDIDKGMEPDGYLLQFRHLAPNPFNYDNAHGSKHC